MCECARGVQTLVLTIMREVPSRGVEDSRFFSDSSALH